MKGGVCLPLDFVAGGIHCGIKTSDREDLAIVYSQRNSVAAATFTTNQVKAAPVKISMKHVRSRSVRAVVLNSGNANACTGKQGLDDALSMAKITAEALNLPTQQVLVCSTGRIGVPMPMEKIIPKLRRLAGTLTSQGGETVARAIMTSDTYAKEAARELFINGIRVRLGAAAKGAGMINPNMATMLCVITTDATISSSVLHQALREAVAHSFNRITIDGDMSTNDTVIALANSASKCAPIRAGSAEYAMFLEALHSLCLELARMIVLDGEGVSKFVEVEVRGAVNNIEARYAAEAVANSILLKCAWAGNDPNWGRIMDALGYSKANIQEDQIDIFLNQLPMVTGGVAGPASITSLRKAAAGKAFRIGIDLHLGQGRYAVLTTDLTEEYIRLNLGE
ncbi:MAG: bifunctional glutamate N-acetyltransferase/amino-acid acetyltransferase ArgJ [Verrucomicrobia bacterium]|nr:MAG: bifunctional glutamate N-acetyltransferase/amino-acid acetyltransferase ArgJ [Verrucomicrobiota bacterium]